MKSSILLLIALQATLSVAYIRPFDGSTINRKDIESDTFANDEKVHIIVEPLTTVGAYDLFFHPQVEGLRVCNLTYKSTSLLCVSIIDHQEVTGHYPESIKVDQGVQCDPNVSTEVRR